MQDLYKPRIGITMGDPNGIGPEVVLKALCCAEIQSVCRPVVFGNSEILGRAKEIIGMDAVYELQEHKKFNAENLDPGSVSSKSGRASLGYIESAVQNVLENKIDCIVTAPISKEAIHRAGSKYPGHTEMLAELSGCKEVAMMFEGDKFKVVLITIHNALKKVPELLAEEKIYRIINLTNESLIKYFRIIKPKIVVCGLNPHAGESGAFGKEEIEYIKPAVIKAMNDGIDIEGPLPPDTLFYYASKGKWDLVVSMYHDQGLIPFKMINFEKGVNVTLGLPFIRTSPDHGTAFDIAWKGIANPTSMIEAIKVAVNMYQNSHLQ